MYLLYQWCFLAKYLVSLWPTTRIYSNCPGLKSFNFLMSSKPWQCEVQMDLFMPDNLLRLGKHTEIFDQLSNERSTGLPTIPSLRPPIYILMNKKSVVGEYELVSLAEWTNTRIEEDYMINHVQLTGHLICKSNYQTLKINLECNVVKFNAIFPCPECTKYVNVYPVNLDCLSFSQIAHFDRAQKFIAIAGKIISYNHAKLAGAIMDHADNEPDKIKQPLKAHHLLNLRIPDKLQLLGFAYASIFTIFMGNLTSYNIGSKTQFELRRLVQVDEEEFENH